MIAETSRLKIRPFTCEDLPLLERLHGNEDVMRYHPGFLPRPKERIAIDLKTIVDHQDKYGYSFWAVFDKEGAFLGRTGLWHLDKTEKIELGYSLFKQYWGKGYATEMAQKVLELGFKEIKLNEIFVIIHPENSRSHHVARKLGFQFVQESVYYNMPAKLYSITHSMMKK